MRLLLVAALSVVGAAAWAQDSGARVSFSCRAEPVGKMLAELSQVAHLKLEANTQALDDVVVIHVQDVPLGDLMRRIALVTSGAWEKEGGGYLLVGDPATRNREAAAERAKAIDAAKATIDKRLEALKAKPDQPGTPSGTTTITAGASGGSIQGGPPADEKALTLLLDSIGPAALADIDSGERVVYSSAPTAMQRPLPVGAAGIVSDWISEHNASVPDMQKRMDDFEKSEKAGQMPDFAKRLMNRYATPINSVGKSLLVVSRPTLAAITQVTLVVYDTNGKVAGSAQTSLLSDSLQQLAAAIVKPTSGPASTGTPVKYSDDSAALRKAFATMRQPGQGFMPHLSADLRNRVFHPTENDPLSFMATDELVALADAKHLPLVANVPDSAFDTANAILQKETTTVEDVEKAIHDGSEEVQAPDDGWLTIEPARPAEARAKRLDRHALEALMAAALAKGAPSLDDVAAYALKAPSPLEGGPSQVYLTMFVPGVITQSTSGITDWNMLRIYGSLNDLQRQTLESGGRLSLRTIPDAYARQLLYGPMAHFDVTRAGQTPPPQDTISYWISMFAGGGGEDYKDEPTELMPNGVPPNGYFEMSTTTEPIASVVGPDGSPGNIVDAESLAAIRFFQESDGFKQFSNLMPNIEKVRVGQRKLYAFTFHVAPDASTRQTLADNSVPQDADPIAMSDLPSDFKKLIDDKEAEVKKSPLGALSSLLGPQRPTP